jgi:hypothetical protein
MSVRYFVHRLCQTGCTVALVLFFALPASAQIVVNAYQDGGNVLFNFSGSLNTTAGGMETPARPALTRRVLSSQSLASLALMGRALPPGPEASTFLT